MASKKTAIATLNASVSDTINRLNNSETAIGLDVNGNYVADSSAFYVSSATTVKSAIGAVDVQLYSVATTFAPLSYVDTQISNLVNAAPGILDTLSEIATSINNDPNIATTLSTQISTESTRARAAETTLTSNLNTEITRATGVESTIIGNLNTEITRATTAENTLQTNISGENTRATAAETVLSNLISSEVTNRTTALSTFTTLTNSTIADLSGNLHIAIDTEKTRAEGAELVLTNAISNESSRAGGVENTLTSDLSSEATRAQNAESTITVSLNAEVSRAQGAESALDGRVSTIELTYIKKDGSVAFTGNVDLNNNLIINLATPVNDYDASNKAYVDSKVTNLGSVFSYVGTIDPISTPNLDSLTNQVTGYYYRAIEKGTLSFNSGAGSISVNIGDGIVKSTIGWDIIDNTDPLVSGTSNRLDVTGNANDGYVIDINASYVGQSTITTVGTITTGVWTATTVATTYGGSGQTTYAEGDLLVGSGSTLAKLALGADGTILRSVGGTTSWVAADTANVALTDATNFSTSVTLQQGLDYLYNYTQIRKLAQHAITSTADYQSSSTPNVNLLNGKVNFVNYDGTNSNIYLPPSNAGLINGTVFRIVHNGTFSDPNFTVRYYDVGTSSNVNVLELAPRDSIALVWNQSQSSYLFAVGI
jgi:hypothetical protein